MSDLTLTKIRLRNRRWEGRLTGAPAGGPRPEIAVTYLDTPVTGVVLSEGPEAGSWDLIVTIPDEAVTDGVHCFVILDAASGAKLSDFAVIAGEAITDDLRAEVELLRAELDMLKRAFRRHCLETM
ncbi:hypothetical protein [Antarcticimicrobium luteum]|uniref:Uncharacterized protein n=1 Tax=Antarcticimicrobium luteum TaxID=2547397 RepID=A0A4R5V5L7_9RHOB|nr:hypothetical protein [Antarcticimicrobium luteum]TDK46845.1 hypothetical protein E1832_12165 [Antarcticimicrobium luteum]